MAEFHRSVPAAVATFQCQDLQVTTNVASKAEAKMEDSLMSPDTLRPKHKKNTMSKGRNFTHLPKTALASGTTESCLWEEKYKFPTHNQGKSFKIYYTFCSIKYEIMPRGWQSDDPCEWMGTKFPRNLQKDFAPAAMTHKMNSSIQQSNHGAPGM